MLSNMYGMRFHYVGHPGEFAFIQPPIIAGHIDSRNVMFIISMISMLFSLVSPFSVFDGGEVWKNR